MAKRVYDWNEVQRYHDAGHGCVECCRHFGFCYGAWTKAIKRGDLIARFRVGGREVFDPSDRRRIYDWAEVQLYYDRGHSFRECQARFGFSNETWHKARKRGEIISRPLGMPIQRLLQVGKSRRSIKARLLNAGILSNVCSECGLCDWRDKPLTMHIDHINGVKDDHRLENLRMLCPNCHSQTDTYGGRNVKRRRLLQDDRGSV